MTAIELDDILKDMRMGLLSLICVPVDVFPSVVTRFVAVGL